MIGRAIWPNNVTAIHTSSSIPIADVGRLSDTGITPAPITYQ